MGGEYVHANITLANIVSELASWECDCFSDERETIAFIKARLTTYGDALGNQPLHEKAYPLLKEDISSFIRRL